MNDDFGRGMLGWPAERWQALDTLAADSVVEHAVMRGLVEQREAASARSARIAAQNVDVATISEDFEINMQDDEDEDVERKVRLHAQNLAEKEDQTILKAMDLANPRQADPLVHKVFIAAKNDLKGKKVQNGLGVVVSADALTDLETEAAGAQSGLDVAERLLGAKFLQCNALPYNKIEAVLVQASPPAYRMVRAWGPRLRVRGVQDGNKVSLRIEEGIAVGKLEDNRCLAIQRGAPPVKGAKAPAAKAAAAKAPAAKAPAAKAPAAKGGP